MLATFTCCSSAYNTLVPILFRPLIPPLPIHLINQLLPAPISPNILPEHLKRALRIRITAPTDMRRDEAIRRIPQRVVSRQGLRVRDVECGAGYEAFFQCGDERGLVYYLAARNVGNVGAARVGGVQELELGRREEVRCCFAGGCISISGLLLVGREWR
jgi:hypothetical protein